MKLLTLNCHSWQEDRQIEKIKYLAKVIVEKDYDVIALQEVSQSINSKVILGKLKEDNFAILLVNEICKLGGNKYNLAWDFSHIGYDIYEEGLCILSKHKLISTESFYISRNKEATCWKSRKIVKAMVDYDGENIDFYSCHLGWFNDVEDSFKEQANNLYSKSLQSYNLAFFMGDFNNSALVRNEGYDFLIGNGLLDAYDLAKKKDSGITVIGSIAGWDDNTEEIRVDIIFVNRKVKILESKVIFNGENKEIISDHFGVEVIL